MKKLYLILVLWFCVNGILPAQSGFLTPLPGQITSDIWPERTSFSAFDVSNNIMYGCDGVAIYIYDLVSKEQTEKYDLPDDYASAFPSFVKMNAENTMLWAGFTVSGNSDDRIYSIDVSTGEWTLKANLTANFDLAFLGENILVSGSNSSDFNDPNAIWLLDVSGNNEHEKIIEVGGYGAGLTADSDGNVYSVTSLPGGNNALYRWDAAQINDAIDSEPAINLALSDATTITDLPAGGNNCESDAAGNLLFNFNDFTGSKVVALWNGQAGNGFNFDTLAVAEGPTDWLSNLTAEGDVRIPGSGNHVYALSYNTPVGKIRSDYTRGAFIVNEDWFGHSTGTVNFLTNDGHFAYRAYRDENPGEELGVTSPFGAIYGDRFYMMSKQGTRLVVADATTLTKQAAFESLPGDTDGRAFTGVTPQKGYISTSDGISLFDIETLTMGEPISGTSGQVGGMLRAGDYVFAVKQSEIYIINVTTHQVETTITGGAYSGIAQTMDGHVWIGGGSYLLKINPYTLINEEVALAEDAHTGSSWGAWNAGTLCASATENALYWGNDAGWSGSTQIYKYEVGNPGSLDAPFINVAEGMELYGAGFRVHPESNQVYISAKKSGWGANSETNAVYIHSGETGELISAHEMEPYYWFPAMVVFPDVYAPEFDLQDVQMADSDMPLKWDIPAFASDKDNNDAAILVTVSNNSNPSVAEVKMEAGQLIISPKSGQEGSATIDLSANSNGKVVTASFLVTVSEVTAIEKPDENKITIFPVPFSTEFTISGGNLQDARYKICALDGRVMRSGRIASREQQVNTSDIPAGTYIIVVETNEGVITQKVVKY